MTSTDSPTLINDKEDDCDNYEGGLTDEEEEEDEEEIKCYDCGECDKCKEWNTDEEDDEEEDDEEEDSNSIIGKNNCNDCGGLINYTGDTFYKCRCKKEEEEDKIEGEKIIVVPQ
jgi:hypothetical protein